VKAVVAFVAVTMKWWISGSLERETDQKAVSQASTSREQTSLLSTL